MKIHINWMGCVGFCVSSVLLVVQHSWAARPDAPDTTTIQVTDELLVKDCTALGTNLNGRNLLKRHVEVNFEGSSHRVCLNGEVFRDEFLCYTFGKAANNASQLDKHWPGGTILILSGPAKGEKRTIAKVEFRQADTWPWSVARGETTIVGCLAFDRPIEGLPEKQRVDLQRVLKAKGNVNLAFADDPLKNVGALIEKNYLGVGYCGRSRDFIPDGSGKSTTVQGDTPPGSFGVSALLVDAGEKPANLRFPMYQHAYANCNGIYHVSLWAKAKSGSPQLKVTWDRLVGAPEQKVTPTRQWKEYKLSFDLRGMFPAEAPSPRDSDQMGSRSLFVIEGGIVLLDDIAISFEGDENPTPFRDDIVDVLGESRVGVLRLLQEGGDTMVNTISPRMRQHSYDGSLWTPKGDPTKRSWFSGQRHYTLHELFTLCEYLGCEPWYCLPGTLYPEEIDIFMEYVGAPPDVGYGKVRAAQGHPRPWTETLRRIHVEFGNEIWNFVGEYKVSSYDGPDYWEGMIRRAKESPYYKDNVILVMGTDSKLDNVPSADRVMRRASYVIHDLPQEELDRHKTREDLFRWVFGRTLLQNVFGEGMSQLSQKARAAGQELAIYEVNYHATKPDETLQTRNEIVSSLAGGVNMANSMLGMMKRHQVRTQCFFTFMGQYNKTRLWGGVINARHDNRRYRSTWLGVMLANQVIDGDLVETVHSGKDPRFVAFGQPGRKWAKEGKQEFPALYSYAFHNNSKQGLILVNLDLVDSQNIVVTFEGNATGSAHRWLLSGDSPIANNELEQPQPQVTITEDHIAHFRSGYHLALPPHSMTALQWQTR